MTLPQVAEIVTSQTSSLQANLTQTNCDPQRNADMDSWLRMADGLSQQESRAAIKTLPDMLPVTNPCL